MSTIQYNFKSIPIIPNANNLIDIILSRTQTKTPTVTHPGYKITRIRKFYMRKVRFTYSTIQEKLDGIIKNFPKLDEIHPFYSDTQATENFLKSLFELIHLISLKSSIFILSVYSLIDKEYFFFFLNIYK